MKFFLFSFFLLGALVGLSFQACPPGFADAFLAKHNELRAKHGVGNLELDPSISTFAQEWADHLATNGNFLGVF